MKAFKEIFIVITHHLFEYAVILTLMLSLVNKYT